MTISVREDLRLADGRSHLEEALPGAGGRGAEEVPPESLYTAELRALGERYNGDPWEKQPVGLFFRPPTPFLRLSAL
jgi:hypothetical protein